MSINNNRVDEINKSEGIVAALTGGIGTGKSTVAKILVEKGYPVISADEIARDLTANDPETIGRIKAEFGQDIYATSIDKPNGVLDSKRLAALVFGASPEADRNLAALNSIVHPKTIDIMAERVDEELEKGRKIVFVESALAYEAELDEGFDYIVMVDAPEDAVIARLKSNRSMSEDEIRLRIESQMPNSEKRAAADFTIDNKGTLEDLRNSTELILIFLNAIAG